MYAAGVILFQLAVGFAPFTEANMKDQFFKLLQQKRSVYWDAYAQGRPEMDEIFNCGFKDLIYSMLSFHRSKRLTIKEIMEHPWMQEAAATQQEVLAYMSKKLGHKDDQMSAHEASCDEEDCDDASFASEMCVDKPASECGSGSGMCIEEEKEAASCNYDQGCDEKRLDEWICDQDDQMT